MTRSESASPAIANVSYPTMLDREIGAACAWRRADIEIESCRVPLGEAALDELETLARGLADRRGPIEDLVPDAFALPATADVMAGVKARLDQGVGFAVLDRLPVARWGERASKSVAWLLTGLLGIVVIQKWDGTRLYDVCDTRKPLGYGVRRSVTNLGQEFHTDGGWLTLAPEAIALLCLRPAEAGGMSRVASLATAHDVLRARHPELLARLYRPFWWDRQAEHAPDQPRCSRHPVYRWDGRRLTARYYDDYLRNGHRMMAAPLDEIATAALDAVRAVVESPEHWIEFGLEQGQVEFVNNDLLAHARTAFRDAGPPGTGRHLVRLWSRSAGGIALEPSTTGT